MLRKAMLTAAAICWLCAIIPTSTHAQTLAGVTLKANGDVEAVRKEEATAHLASKSPIFDNDVIRTGPKSAASFEFTDGARLEMGASSQAVIAEFVMANMEPDLVTMVLNLGQGLFRAVTGKIAKANPSRFKVECPLGVIGVRGTGLAFLNEPGRNVAAVLHDGPAYFIDAEFDVTREIKAGMAVTKRKGQPVGEPAPITMELKELLQQLDRIEEPKSRLGQLLKPYPELPYGYDTSEGRFPPEPTPGATFREQDAAASPTPAQLASDFPHVSEPVGHFAESVTPPSAWQDSGITATPASAPDYATAIGVTSPGVLPGGQPQAAITGLTTTGRSPVIGVQQSIRDFPSGDQIGSGISGLDAGEISIRTPNTPGLSLATPQNAQNPADQPETSLSQQPAPETQAQDAAGQESPPTEILRDELGEIATVAQDAAPGDAVSTITQIIDGQGGVLSRGAFSNKAFSGQNPAKSRQTGNGASRLSGRGSYHHGMSRDGGNNAARGGQHGSGGPGGRGRSGLGGTAGAGPGGPCR